MRPISLQTELFLLSGLTAGSVFLVPAETGAQPAVTALLAMAVPLYARARLFRPLQRIIGSMQALAAGNVNIDCLPEGRKDEIGAMVGALQVFRKNVQEHHQREEEQKQALIDASDERRRMRAKLASDFEAEVQGTITSVSQAAAELCRVAEAMQKTVSDTGKQSGGMAEISQNASHNVANISAAVEEMSASVKEIAGQASQSSSLVGETVSRTAQADKTTHMLSEAVAQISGILQLIQDIAGQINLLALNATIESARAGEAGKGFAVVASEVKNLASQTTRATEEIARQIDSVQRASVEVVEVLKNIQQGIASVNQYSVGISAAVEEQSAATREISANMQHTALGVQNITGNLSAITGNILQADQAAQKVLGAAQVMTQQSGLLKEQVSQFLSGIKG